MVSLPGTSVPKDAFPAPNKDLEKIQASEMEVVKQRLPLKSRGGALACAPVQLSLDNAQLATKMEETLQAAIAIATATNSTFTAADVMVNVTVSMKEVFNALSAAEAARLAPSLRSWQNFTYFPWDILSSTATFSFSYSAPQPAQAGRTIDDSLAVDQESFQSLVVVSAVVGVALVSSVVAILFVMRRRMRRTARGTKSNAVQPLTEKLPAAVFEYEEAELQGPSQGDNAQPQHAVAKPEGLETAGNPPASSPAQAVPPLPQLPLQSPGYYKDGKEEEWVLPEINTARSEDLEQEKQQQRLFSPVRPQQRWAPGVGIIRGPHQRRPSMPDSTSSFHIKPLNPSKPLPKTNSEDEVHKAALRNLSPKRQLPPLRQTQGNPRTTPPPNP